MTIPQKQQAPDFESGACCSVINSDITKIDVSKSILQVRSSINGSYLACLTSINDRIAEGVSQIYLLQNSIGDRPMSLSNSFLRRCATIVAILRRRPSRFAALAGTATKRSAHSPGRRRAPTHSVCVRGLRGARQSEGRNGNPLRPSPNVGIDVARRACITPRE